MQKLLSTIIPKNKVLSHNGQDLEVLRMNFVGLRASLVTVERIMGLEIYLVGRGMDLVVRG